MNSSTRPPRVAIGGFLHETNTFAPSPATLACFTEGGGAGGVFEGEAAVAALRGVNVGFAGALAYGETAGWEVIPTVWAAASPSAHVTEEAFETITGKLLAGIEAALPLAGVYLDLHGAMVTTHRDDGEGEILARVRALVGPDVPIISSLDLHANVTARMVEEADLLVSYRTYPHVDMNATGARAARALGRLIDGAARPLKAFRQAPYLLPIAWQCTDMEPAHGLYAQMEACEGDWPMSLNMGFPAADFADCGAAVTAYGDTAEVDADALMAAVVAAEPRFTGRVFGPDEAVAEAIRIARTANRPVVIADSQDNPGAGGDSDTMGMVRALRAAAADMARALPGAPGPAIGSIYDPAAAAAAHEAGVGARVRLSLGAKSRIPGDTPLETEFEVEALSDGRFVCPGPYHGGQEVQMGPSACLVLDGVRIVVVSAKAQMADQAMFRQVGIEPKEAAILCVKSSVHFRADFDPIAETILTAAAPGPMPVSPASLPWKRLRAGVRLEPLGAAYAP
ncbi:M81 family metallopeptidase [Pikeienuella piscinae]|uniref:Microcystinase C n=1 Tax=Pikeienuella piscinae TaxID=2748098 RepID=A0A7L5BX77_9RHOB|nr:M81 family metallopeptidase [Pikeienuella piscinae]QIE55127.1 M81 family metallopeptidase [Pikeienuella piscinae]